MQIKIKLEKESINNECLLFAWIMKKKKEHFVLALWGHSLSGHGMSWVLLPNLYFHPVITTQSVPYRIKIPFFPMYLNGCCF